MSRPIKFRAWDKRNKCWVQSFTVFKTGAIQVKGGRPKTYDAANPRFILEQFTNFKDCNGRDIYENDIVYYGGIVCQVIFDLERLNAGWELVSVDRKNPERVPMPLGIPIPDVMKIAGNIHDNSELMEVKR